jgi:tRNA dimethylallyltransferase
VTSAPPLIVIAGQTATGKTALAIALARRLASPDRPVEIISADSRQVFRGLDIGTAKAGPAERALVPHHGLDLVDPDAPFSVADFATHASGVLADLGRRRGIAILAGGTGLYLRAVARGLDTDALPSDAAVRRRIEEDLDREGVERLAIRLTAIAPALATTVDLRNPRRVVRALEIAEILGDAPRPPARGYPGPVSWLGLHVTPAAHRARIDARARAQFEGGLIDEARALRERFDPGLPAFSAIGYREAWGVIDGALGIDEAIALDVQRNVAFARRQRTWFRAEPGIEWLDASDEMPLDAAAAAAGRLLDLSGR